MFNWAAVFLVIAVAAAILGLAGLPEQQRILPKFWLSSSSSSSYCRCSSGVACPLPSAGNRIASFGVEAPGGFTRLRS